MSNKTVDEARAELFADAYRGNVCPCCNQHVQAYRRTLNSSMVLALVMLARNPERENFVHTERYLASLDGNAAMKAAIRGDVAKLVHWGLLEKQFGRRPDGSKANGYYRVTSRAMEFVLGHIAVPKHAYIYNDTLLGLSDGTNNTPQLYVTADECLRSGGFNYSELVQPQELGVV